MRRLWFLILLLTFISLSSCSKERVSYMECQHPTILYYDRTYFRNPVTYSRRYSRENPLYFTSIHGITLRPLDETYMFHFYVYELLSNTYKRSLVELHFSYCDFLRSDSIFGRVVKSTNFALMDLCPLPPGDYGFENMTGPYGYFLKGFPFTHGRIYINFTNVNRTVIGHGYIDMQIKEISAAKFHTYIK